MSRIHSSTAVTRAPSIGVIYAVKGWGTPVCIVPVVDFLKNYYPSASHPPSHRD